MSSKALRLTEQALLPRQRPPHARGYDLYPVHTLAAGSISAGFDALAAHLETAQRVMIDGYVGVLWADFADRLNAALERRGRRAEFFDVGCALRSEAALAPLLEPFLGGDDPLFGRRTTLRLADLFDRSRLPQPTDDPPVTDLSVVYGCGAALCDWPDALTVYVDLPKNELQFRSRAGAVANLGRNTPLPPGEAYKRFYFVDWVLLNAHKRQLLPRLELLVDGQHPADPAMISGRALRAALSELATSAFRVRPWLEPGAWGGQWLKQQIDGLPQSVPNYAWSFELIVPENGLVLESGDLLLELSFDFLMYQEGERVLGAHHPRFGCDFPIRFDYLDTLGGGNLSVQCHPRPEYMQKHFGEPFTQDETYYIVRCDPGAQVYLGFHEGVDRDAFAAAVTHSEQTGSAAAIEQFVHAEPSQQHGLYLIPNGTVHSSGAGNLVLEISATPYIFTFKIYDWLRLGLDGQPRPLNIARAVDNLYFDDPSREPKALVAQPVVLSETATSRVVHLPTHEEHFYDVHRLEFSACLPVETAGSPHVLCVVEGASVKVHLEDKEAVTYAFAETFVIPAAVTRYVLESPGGAPLKVIQAFLKPPA